MDSDDEVEVDEVVVEVDEVADNPLENKHHNPIVSIVYFILSPIDYGNVLYYLRYRPRHCSTIY